MSQVKVPTVFTAVDRMSRTMQVMGRSVTGFAARAEVAVARADRAFRRFTPSLSAASKELLSFASTAAVTAGIVGGFYFSVNAIKDYETALASAQAITGTTNEEFALFRTRINEVAAATRKSSVDVAKAFELIGSAQPELLGSADALGAVTKATIILSKASRDDLEVSARNLTGVMNQFSLSADQAERTMNVLAAGAKVGAASIPLVGESMKNFGSVAAGANISLEESVALVEVLGKFSVFGAEAGTKLRGSILKLQQAGVGYASGQFEINDALREASERIGRLRTEKERDAALNKMFGAENISTGRILLSNIALFEQYTKGVTNTNTAVEMAEVNSRTFNVALEEMRNKWVNILTGSEKATGGLETVRRVVVFLTNNMDALVSVGTKVLLFFVLWKSAILLAQGALWAYRTALFAVTVATQVWGMVTSLAAIGALAPILLIVAAFGLLVAVIVSVGRNWGRIVEAFRNNGILGGIKMIGAALLDTVLAPLQAILKLASRIVPKRLGGGALANASQSVEELRVRMGVREPGEQAQAVNAPAERQEAMVSRLEETRNNNVVFDFKNVPKGLQVSENGQPSAIPNLTSSFAL